MKKQAKYLLLMATLLAIYYILGGIYLNRLGYFNPEALFYSEKSRLVLNGLGNRLQIMGLTSPIIPFYTAFIFSPVNSVLAPVIASAICTAMLFFIIASALIKSVKGTFYLLILLIVFVFHPGILYAACSGKSTAIVLIFFFLFFFNLLKFYSSNTTFHISIASICLLLLIFCDYKFIWLTLFFVPLILSIAIQSLNLSEQESILRLFMSFNNPSLRRKLINKTFAFYIILFILPITCIICYRLLNLTHANDLNYFNESPYATWTILADKLTFDQLSTTAAYQLPEASILISAKILLFCPLILVAIYLFRHSTYQMLTLLTPFAFVEFLHIKYVKVYLVNEYYIMFLILSILCILYKIQTAKNKGLLKLVIGIVTLIQLYTGFLFLKNSSISSEQTFITTLFSHSSNVQQNDNHEIANYLNRLPNNVHILADDAIAYPIVAFTNNIGKLTLPYQDTYLNAIEAPDKYDDYVLLATDKNEVAGFTQLNEKYIPIIKKTSSSIKMRRVYETDNWILYKVL